VSQLAAMAGHQWWIANVWRARRVWVYRDHLIGNALPVRDGKAVKIREGSLVIGPKP
jgi:hypothetical protein